MAKTYKPGQHTGSNKPYGAWGVPDSARYLFYNEDTFTYRPFASTTEVFSYFSDTKARLGNPTVLIQEGSILKEYWFTDTNTLVAKLEKGDPGVNPVIGPNGNWFVAGVDTGVHAEGPKGNDFKYSDFTPGQLEALKGEDGKDGINGQDGYTPIKDVDYFDGSDGTNGTDGTNGVDGITPVKGVDYFDGIDGTNGIDGIDGEDGITPHIGSNKNWFIGDVDTGVRAEGKDGSGGGGGGADGITPHIDPVTKNWFIDTFDTGVKAEGIDGEDGYTPVKGIDYFDGADGTNGTDGYTPIKGVDYVDGIDGTNGIDGEDGEDGNDGYTPVKGVDYFDGVDGKDGEDGYTPIKDVDYRDGIDGYTPIKGVDYFDGNDANVTNANVLAAIGYTPADVNNLVELGETITTAYRGDRGKIAYDHSQVAHAPANAQKNSDITKAEIETKLTGAITSHTHSADDITESTTRKYVTQAEKDKIASLDSGKFKGQFTSYAQLEASGSGEVGAYAYVDLGAGSNVEQYIWDTTDLLWIQSAGSSTAETPASVKSKYESNANTNAFEDTEKAKLLGLPADAQKNSDITKSEIEAKLTGEITSHTHPATQITESTSRRFITDAERIAWNESQKNSDITKAEIEAQLTGEITTHTHPAAQVTESTTKRFVSDAEKATWNAKADIAGAASTGGAIQFDKERIYGSNASPIAANLTTNTSGAVAGVTAKIFHRKTAPAPTMPATWKKATGSQDYDPEKVNRIYVQYEDASNILYTISY